MGQLSRTNGFDWVNGVGQLWVTGAIAKLAHTTPVSAPWGVVKTLSMLKWKSGADQAPTLIGKLKSTHTHTGAMSYTPAIDHHDAMRQASKTMSVYLDKAITTLDDQFGEGYAKKNPALLAQLVSVSANDYQSYVIERSAGLLANAIELIAHSA